MAFRAHRTERTQRYADLEALIDYCEYEGLWSWRFEEQWLKPRLHDLGYEHIRFLAARPANTMAASGSESVN
jgi:hypothetical protein